MGTTFKRTTIFLTQEQHERLRRLAFERRTSMAKLLRDAALKVLADGEDAPGAMPGQKEGTGVSGSEAR